MEQNTKIGVKKLFLGERLFLSGEIYTRHSITHISENLAASIFL